MRSETVRAPNPASKVSMDWPSAVSSGVVILLHLQPNATSRLTRKIREEAVPDEVDVMIRRDRNLEVSYCRPDRTDS